jgi:hypothetical protein
MKALKTLFLKFAIASSKMLARFFSPELWPDLEAMPMWAWHKLHSTADPTFLMRRGRARFWHAWALGAQWRKLTVEFYHRFGMPTTQRMIFERTKYILQLKIQKYTTEDRSLQLLINIETRELEAMQASVERSTIYEVKASMERALRFVINLHSTSVTEFYSYIQFLNNHGRKQTDKE